MADCHINLKCLYMDTRRCNNSSGVQSDSRIKPRCDPFAGKKKQKTTIRKTSKSSKTPLRPFGVQTILQFVNMCTFPGT